MLGLISIAIATALGGDPPTDDTAKKDRERIQGTWKVVELMADSEFAPSEIVDALKMVIKGDSLKFTPGEPGFTNFIFKIEPDTKPAWFDFVHADGKNKGETKKGIYSLEGDTLRICFGQAGRRPKEFSAKAESGQALYVLKREKP